MKRLLPLLLLATLTTHAQYFSIDIEPNKLFNVFENPMTDEQHKGLDFNLEVGVYAWQTGVYTYYSRFEKIGYQIYGVGIDYYFSKTDWYDAAIGAGIGNLMRRKQTGPDWERTAWFGYATWHIRLQGTFWIWKNFGTTASLTYQRRPDLPYNKSAMEGNIGLRYKI